MADDYNLKKELAFNREKLGTVIPNRLSELLEVIQARKFAPDDWYANLVTKIIASVARVCQDLLQTIEQKEALSAAAWNARNLLELWIWIEYCSASQENARRFHEDALRDGLGLIESHSRMCELTGVQDELGVLKRREIAANAFKKHGIESFDSKYERIANAAKKVKLSESYQACNTHLSKFAHQTAGLVVGTMHQSQTVKNFQSVCTTQGVYFAGRCVMTLDQMVSNIP